MVKAIIFDCFGVLTTDHWKEFVATLSPDQTEQARALMYEHDAGRISLSKVLDEVKKLTQRVPAGVEQLVADEEIKNIDLLTYIGELRHKYKIGLLSNIGSDWIRSEFLSRHEQALFDEMVFSFEVHMAKPDPEIFVLMAKRLGTPLSDCVLVDDSEGHCAAAARLGAKTIVYNDFQQMKRQLEPLLQPSQS